ncbi:hypothetical protein ACEWY4_013412 [Coilia grayii]|uniref:C1q domain-containing protein n=1 Tax=Coilia grayii TaxID=363190 RepID=A0ABD1JW84_9TELE
MMKTIAVLFLALGLCLCQSQNSGGSGNSVNGGNGGSVNGGNGNGGNGGSVNGGSGNAGNSGSGNGGSVNGGSGNAGNSGSGNGGSVNAGNGGSGNGGTNGNNGCQNHGNGYPGCCCVVYSLEKEVANLMDKVNLLMTQLQNAEEDITELQSLIQGKPKVAFSAALLDSGSGDTGPFSVPTPLKYQRVFTSIGGIYQPSTAQVKGMYFFRFSMFNNRSPTPSSEVTLMKNDMPLVSVSDTTGPDPHDMGSNAVVIELDKGDNVYVQLGANRIIYDDESMNYNTFSGFLLFAM